MMKQAEKIVSDVEKNMTDKLILKFRAWVEAIPVCDRPSQWRLILAQYLLNQRNIMSGDKAVIIFKKVR